MLTGHKALADYLLNIARQVSVNKRAALAEISSVVVSDIIGNSEIPGWKNSSKVKKSFDISTDTDGIAISFNPSHKQNLSRLQDICSTAMSKSVENYKQIIVKRFGSK